MSGHLQLQDNDKLFRGITSQPVIVNDLFDTLESDKRRFDEDFLVVYNDTDIMETIPKCRCGVTMGQHHVDDRGNGTICPECNSPVQAVLDKPLEPVVWVRAPEGVDALMNPHAWRHLSRVFSLTNRSQRKFNVIKYLTNTSYKPNKLIHGRWMEEIENRGIKRGLNNFIRNFDYIIDQLCQIPKFSENRSKKERLGEMITFIEMNRERIFSGNLPIHNKTLVVIEDTKFGTYMDDTLKTIIDAVRNISGVDTEINSYSVAQKENRASKLTESLAEFGDQYEREFLARKGGLVRKHCIATRCWFSFRAVIHSITRPHDHDCIKLPWPLATTVFHMHILGKLYRRGFGYNDGTQFIKEHTFRYHPLLREIFDELLSETKYPGIPCLFGRNPTMYRTSLQRMFIDGVEDDVKIFSIGYPIISVAGPNADFDGDQMFGTLTLDNWTTDEVRHLAPHHGAWKLTGPRQIGDNMPLPKPVAASVISYLDNYPEEARRPDPVKLDQMHKMFSIREYA